MENNKFKPYGNNIVVKTDPDITEVDGVMLPENSIIRSQTGEIISIGEGTKGDPMDIEVGNMTIFKKGTGQDITSVVGGGRKHIILDRNDILGTY